MRLDAHGQALWFSGRRLSDEALKWPKSCISRRNRAAQRLSVALKGAMGGLLCLLLGAAAAPCGRWGHTASYSAEAQGVYVFGGRQGQLLGDLQLYDLRTGRWRLLRPGPPRAAHAAAAVGRGLVVFGGLGQGRVLDDLQRYDGEVWWELRPKGVKPSGRYLHGAAWDGKGLYVFGGWGEREQQNDLHFYDEEA